MRRALAAAVALLVLAIPRPCRAAEPGAAPDLHLSPGMRAAEVASEAGVETRLQQARRLEVAGRWTVAAGVGLLAVGLYPLARELLGASACNIALGSNPDADCGISRSSRQRAFGFGLGGLGLAIVGVGLIGKGAQLREGVAATSAGQPPAPPPGS